MKENFVPFNIQPVLETERAILLPLEERDFEPLYLTASDPKIWEQHPNKDRWKKQVFQAYFQGAMRSKGAFKIVEKQTGKVMGCTRFYDFNEKDDIIFIGYTFFATNYWGKGYNLQVKEVMLDYAFQYLLKVGFHIGSNNIRSQIAVSRLGAVKVAEEEKAFSGEAPVLNFVYEINRAEWEKRKEMPAATGTSGQSHPGFRNEDL